MIVQVRGFASGVEEMEYWRICKGRRLDRNVWNGTLIVGWRDRKSKSEVCFVVTAAVNSLSSFKRVSRVLSVAASLVNCLRSLMLDLLISCESSTKPLRISWIPRGTFVGREPNALVFSVMTASWGRPQCFMIR